MSNAVQKWDQEEFRACIDYSIKLPDPIWVSEEERMSHVFNVNIERVPGIVASPSTVQMKPDDITSKPTPNLKEEDPPKIPFNEIIYQETQIILKTHSSRTDAAQLDIFHMDCFPDRVSIGYDRLKSYAPKAAESLKDKFIAFGKFKGAKLWALDNLTNEDFSILKTELKEANGGQEPVKFEVPNSLIHRIQT